MLGCTVLEFRVEVALGIEQTDRNLVLAVA